MVFCIKLLIAEFFTQNRTKRDRIGRCSRGAGREHSFQDKRHRIASHRIASHRADGNQSNHTLSTSYRSCSWYHCTTDFAVSKHSRRAAIATAHSVHTIVCTRRIHTCNTDETLVRMSCTLIHVHTPTSKRCAIAVIARGARTARKSTDRVRAFR